MSHMHPHHFPVTKCHCHTRLTYYAPWLSGLFTNTSIHNHRTRMSWVGFLLGMNKRGVFTFWGHRSFQQLGWTFDSRDGITIYKYSRQASILSMVICPYLSTTISRSMLFNTIQTFRESLINILDMWGLKHERTFSHRIVTYNGCRLKTGQWIPVTLHPMEYVHGFVHSRILLIFQHIFPDEACENIFLWLVSWYFIVDWWLIHNVLC